MGAPDSFEAEATLTGWTGTATCDPFVQSRHAARRYPLVAMVVALMGMIVGVTSLFFLGVAMTLVSIGFGARIGFQASCSRRGWKLESNRLEIDGKRIPLADVSSISVEQRLESWGGSGRQGASGSQWFWVLTLTGRKTREVWFSTEHREADVRWLAEQIDRFRHAREAAPEALDQMLRANTAETAEEERARPAGRRPEQPQ